MARILLIDDSESVLELLARWLREAGHTVVMLAESRGALGTMRRLSPDLVLTDIYMPAPDGLDLIRQMRAEGLAIPCIAMSGKPPDLNFFQLARALGAVTTLQLPFTQPTLVAAINRALGRAPQASTPPPASSES